MTMSEPTVDNQTAVLPGVDSGVDANIASHVAMLYGEPMATLPTDLYIPPDALEIFLDAFEGPLDQLL